MTIPTSSTGRYVVGPSVGCEFIPPEPMEHEDGTAYRGRVALHRRVWERHPCEYTGRIVTVDQVTGDEVLVVDEKGCAFWIRARRLVPEGES